MPFTRVAIIKKVINNPGILTQKGIPKTVGITRIHIEEDAGKFRNHGECVRDGDRIIFVAPPENMVNPLMNQLFDWMKNSKETVNPLILSCIFHYEFVFIHSKTLDSFSERSN